MRKKTGQNWQSKNVFAGISAIIFMLSVLGCSSLSNLIQNKSSSTEVSRSNQNSTVNSAQNSSNTKPLSKHTPNPSTKNTPPPPEFKKFDIFETGKFYQTSSANGFFEGGKIVRGATYWYSYSDERFKKFDKYNYDLFMNIGEYESPEKAQSFIKNKLAKVIPVEQADKVKLPRCVDEKSDSDDFVGPDKIIKRLRHPNESDIIVVHSGDFNMWDCKRGSNDTEYVYWSDGVYAFKVQASGHSGAKEGEPGSTGYGIAEEFAIDYLAALGQTVTQ